MLKNTKRAAEFGHKVSEGKRKVHTQFANQYLTSFLQKNIDEN